jgi:hypothetical protein
MGQGRRFSSGRTGLGRIRRELEMTNDDAKYRERETEWIELVGRERWLELPKKHRDFLVNTAGIIRIGTPEETARAVKMAEDDAAGKYREWWEKLRGWYKLDLMDNPFPALDGLVAQSVLYRMLQIEQGK